MTVYIKHEFLNKDGSVAYEHKPTETSFKNLKDCIKRMHEHKYSNGIKNEMLPNGRIEKMVMDESLRDVPLGYEEIYKKKLDEQRCEDGKVYITTRITAYEE